VRIPTLLDVIIAEIVALKSAASLNPLSMTDPAANLRTQRISFPNNRRESAELRFPVLAGLESPPRVAPALTVCGASGGCGGRVRRALTVDTRKRPGTGSVEIRPTAKLAEKLMAEKSNLEPEGWRIGILEKNP
jgi:hypothetical protein